MVEEGLKIKISGDVVEVTKSISDLQKELADLESQLKTKTGKAFVDTNKQIEKLAETIKTLKNVGRDGFNDFGEQIGKGAKNINATTTAAQKAAPALNSLGQVARDLPFGFIAIQNNLPIVADQFANLVTSSKGVGGAFKALGSALIGPVGITFAIGAVFAGVTALVQKYGSLGAAIDALIKGGDKLYQQQLLLNEVNKEANKAAGEEIARFKFLEQSATNKALSDKVRLDAIKELRDNYAPYLQTLTDEDILNGKLTTSTNNVVQALRNKALAQAAVAKAGELSTKALDALTQEEDLNAKILVLEQRRDKERGKFRTTQGGTVDIAAETQRTIDAEKVKRDEFRKTRVELEGQIDALFARGQAFAQNAGGGAISTTSSTKALTEEQKKQKAILQERLKGLQQEQSAVEKTVGATSTQYLNLAKTIASLQREISLVGVTDPKQIEEINKTLASSLLKINGDLLNKMEAQRKNKLSKDLQGYEQERKAIESNYGILTDRYLALQRTIASTKANIDLVGEQDPAAAAKIRDTLANTLQQITKEFNEGRIDAGKIDFTSIFDLDTEAAVKRFREVFSAIQKTGFEEATKTAGKVSGKVQIYPSEAVQADINNLQATRNKVAEISSQFTEILGPAIDSVFGAIESGQNVIQALGQSFKRIIIQIGQTIIKAAILAAILASLGLGAPFGAAAGSSGAFGKIFTGILGLGQTAAPGSGAAGAAFGGARGLSEAANFSGVSSGALNVQISGQFVQRGPDLVASINNTNATIGRVG